MEPKFLTIEEILRVHSWQIEHFGGSDGIRDAGLLESAIAMPSAGFGGKYLHEDIFSMAAAYLFHIAQNHPFIDGNKRTGAASALVFLELNGIEMTATDDDLYDLVIEVTLGEADKAAIADFFRAHSVA